MGREAFAPEALGRATVGDPFAADPFDPGGFLPALEAAFAWVGFLDPGAGPLPVARRVLASSRSPIAATVDPALIATPGPRSATLRATAGVLSATVAAARLTTFGPRSATRRAMAGVRSATALATTGVLSATFFATPGALAAAPARACAAASASSFARLLMVSSPPRW